MSNAIDIFAHAFSKMTMLLINIVEASIYFMLLKKQKDP